MNPVTKAYIQLHTAIFLFGFTAILGKLITLEEIELVWYRVLLTTVSLAVVPAIWRSIAHIPARARWQLAGIGVLVALHWVCFFGSIKAANVTVALSVLSTAALFTSLLEPLIYRTRLKWTELVLGLLIVPGMYLIFSFGKGYTTGILLGLGAAVLGSLFSVLNRKMVARYDALPITLVELGSAWVFLSLVAVPLALMGKGGNFIPTPSDWLWLVILALLCTTLAYVLAMNALRYLTAFTSTLSINLEPLYGILMAIALFQEHKDLSPGFYAGAAIILSAVVVHTLLERRARRRAKAAMSMGEGVA